ncbi:MAG: iron ABC transporter permease [Euryarchaeota archaeon]|nr:iron ABC transporter permease [Euryarchaeota archaeon]
MTMEEQSSTVTADEIRTQYKKFIGRKIFFIFLFIVLIVGITGVSTSLGSADLSVWDAYSSILRKPFPNTFESAYLFTWDNVPGSDSEKLKQHLIAEYDIGWVESAEISKSDDGTITIKGVGDNKVKIARDYRDTEKMEVKISGDIDPGHRVDGFKIKEVNGELHLHKATWLADVCVWNLRLPRIFLGIVAGFGLGLAGCVMQAILRNPLASPYTLGISSGAGFGASLAILAGAGIVGGKYLIIGNAFIFALLVAFIILGLSSRKGATPETMILAGIAMMYLFGAMTTILQYFGEAEAVKEAVFWMVGDLNRASWSVVTIVSVAIALCTPYLMAKSWDLNVMGAGDETAKSLGVNVKRTRVLTMVVSTVMVATIVCFTGTIGFIGLVAPHMTRLAIGGDNRYVLPVSGLLGAVILISADLVARRIMAPIILPVGAVTAFMGAPLFLYLIMRRRREYW